MSSIPSHGVTNPRLSTANPRSGETAGQVRVQRTIRLDQTLDATWRLLSTPEHLSTWLVDTFDVELRVGATGHVIDDGRRRLVQIDAVEDRRQLAFTWRDVDGQVAASHVEIEVEGRLDGTSVVTITETLLASDVQDMDVDRTRAALAWEVRATALWACTVAMALVQ